MLSVAFSAPQTRYEMFKKCYPEKRQKQYWNRIYAEGFNNRIF